MDEAQVHTASNERNFGHSVMTNGNVGAKSCDSASDLYRKTKEGSN